MLRACSRCGSTDLSIPRFQDGVVPETDNLGEWVCRHCGQKGIPIEFDDLVDLEAFRKGLASDAT